MIRATALAIALATPILLIEPLALTAPVMAAEQAPASYTKKTVAVFASGDQRNVDDMVHALTSFGRFNVLTVPVEAGDNVATFTSRVKTASAAAGMAGSPAYVFSSFYSFGAIQSTEMKVDSRQDTATGKITGETFAYLECPLHLTVEIRDANAGTMVKQLRYDGTLQRKYMYEFTEATTPDAHREKQRDLVNTMMRDQRVPPETSFDGLAFAKMGSWLGGSLVADLRRMEEFQLVVGVTGWDAKNDRIFFGLGQELKVHVDDSFKVFQNGREVGYLKVRDVKPNSSSAQPIFMDAALRVGDKVVEYPKANWWNTFKAGAVWMGRPGVMVSYDGDLDMGAWMGISEMSFTYHGAYLNNFLASGFQGELGLSKKWFSRRWGFSVGPRFGVTALSGVKTNATAPGATLMSNLHCYLTPDIVWSTDLGFTAYPGMDAQKMGLPGITKATMINPFGPLVQTGFSFVF